MWMMLSPIPTTASTKEEVRFLYFFFYKERVNERERESSQEKGDLNVLSCFFLSLLSPFLSTSNYKKSKFHLQKI